jgi:hypothetical protein
MKRSDGSEVDLAAELGRLIPSMSEGRRKQALSIISEIRRKKKR